MGTLCFLVAVLAGSILTRHLNFVGDDDAVRRRMSRRVALQILHLNTMHYPLLALGKCHISSNGVVTTSSASVTLPAAEIAAATNGSKPGWRLVRLLGRPQTTAEYWSEPGFDEWEDQGKIGGEYGNESFASSPGASKLCSVDRVL